MKVCEQILGNVADPEWGDRLSVATRSTLVLDEWEKQKPRLRRTTADGLEIAVNLDRGVTLKDGDILDWDREAKRAVVVKVQANEVLHIRLEPAESLVMVERALKLGHALGNQHWPAVVKGTSIYVPLRVDKRVMTTVLRTQNIPGVTYEFVSGEGLNLPAIAAVEHDHHHHHDHGHTHEHSHSQSHPHTHEHVHEEAGA